MKDNILVVGLGLIGGSYARKLSSFGYKVRAIDTSKDALKYGIENKFIINENESDQELISKSDFIIICLYPSLIIKWVENNKQYIKKDTIITDASGVKLSLVDKIQGLLINGEFIASHPMAGREVSGVENSLEDLFLKANFIITPTSKNKQETIDYLKEFAKVVGFSNVEVVSPYDHDQIIGYLSQLTHAIAVCLMNARNTEHYIRYTGDSFRDLTRISKINEDLWSELFIMNKDILVDEIEVFTNELNKLKKAIKDEDYEELKKQFRASSKSRKLFDK